MTTTNQGVRGPLLACLFAAIPLGAAQLGAQEVQILDPHVRRASHIVIPQARGFNLNPNWRPIQVEAVEARVQVLEGAATTTLDVKLKNLSGRRAEAVVLLPVPEGAAVGEFAFEGPAPEATAQVLPRDEARRLYQQIVSRVRDPALLEFAGFRLVRTSVFPLEPNGRQRVRLSYNHLLEVDGNRFDYVLPRSESLDSRVPWKITLDLQAGGPISMVYSPTHDLLKERRNARHMVVRLAESSARDAGPFQLSYLLESDQVSTSIFAYPDPKIGGGYFLLMGGVGATHEGRTEGVKREVLVVIDRSGSMAGEKMDQVRAAALQVIEGLDEGEAFNIIDYATRVESFAAKPVIKDRETTLAARRYLESLRTTGGTNIHDALVESLRQPPTPGTLPIVLFLTDGLPTVRETSELAIREVVEKGNPHKRRVFTFGVGNDVNVPLLDRVADVSRALATYVLPREDVELKVAQVFRRLYGPVLSDLDLTVHGTDGEPSTQRVHDLIPHRLPDVFEGDAILLLGKYRGAPPKEFAIRGRYYGEVRRFEIAFEEVTESTRFAFVPRLWASRRIAYLVDQIRQMGASQVGSFDLHAAIAADPRFKELADEILKLSAEFGVLSEYTSFLATEGSDLGNWEELALHCNSLLDDRAVRLRSGNGAVSQGRNFNEGKLASKLNYANRMWTADGQSDLDQVEFHGCQQIADRGFFKRGEQWIDGRLVAAREQLEADEVIEFGSERHLLLLEELAQEGKQGLLALRGEILLEHEGRKVLVRSPQPGEPSQAQREDHQEEPREGGR